MEQNDTSDYIQTRHFVKRRASTTTKNLKPHLHVCHFPEAHLAHEFGALWLSPEVVGAARVVHVPVCACAPGLMAWKLIGTKAQPLHLRGHLMQSSAL